MIELRLLEGEEIVMELRPHPLAFVRFLSICAYFMAVGASFNYVLAEVSKALGIPITTITGLMVWWALILIAPLIVGLFHITFWPLVCASCLGALGTALLLTTDFPFSGLAPLTVASGIIGLFLVELYRRGHKYYITNQRIIMTKKFVFGDERIVHYDHIVDIIVQKGLLGRIFNFGTVVPLTASGLGLGQDIAGVAVGKQVKRLGLEVAVAGARTVAVPRGRTGLELFGVPRPEDVRDKIEEMRALWKETPYLMRIARDTEEMRKLLRQLRGQLK
ncbi:hypothetical protein DRO33_06265 [Candidatus Bathyarchaeota archaeon]|nr:MAG: hypothetical protein DRO33_06265 [Candidatus Bathyarchaeota archaeon]